MKASFRWQSTGAALLAAMTLVACGGGSADRAAVLPPASTTASSTLATEGFNWINGRRQLAGMSTLTRNGLIDAAATAHSNYQRINGITHVQVVGKEGFTGVQLLDRLTAIGYATPTYYYAEVISSGPSTSGQALADELITAIYHRFAIFQPRYKEMGAGAAGSTGGSNYLTINFAANNGYGPGIGAANVAIWPVNGQTGVVPNFNSDLEAPDPVQDRSEVGYPISVHVDVDVALEVGSFTVKPRAGGANLAVKLLAKDVVGEEDNMRYAAGAAIVPLSPLAANTVYDVSFSGTTNGNPVTRSWSFTTRP
jgi:uncharacterized protein YkwD